MRHILLFAHKNVVLLLQNCKGRNQHASSCCFFQSSEKKGQVCFFSPVWNTAASPAGAQTSTNSLGWIDYMWSPQRVETSGVSHSTPKVSLHLLQRWGMSWYRKEGGLYCWGTGSTAGGCLLGSNCRWLELLKLLAPFTPTEVWSRSSSWAKPFWAWEKKD